MTVHFNVHMDPSKGLPLLPEDVSAAIKAEIRRARAAKEEADRESGNLLDVDGGKRKTVLGDLVIDEESLDVQGEWFWRDYIRCVMR